MSNVIDMLASDSNAFLETFGELVILENTGESITAIVNRNVKHSSDIDAVQWSVDILESDINKPEHNDKIVISGESFSINETRTTRVYSDGVFWKIPVIKDEQTGYRGRRR